MLNAPDLQPLNEKRVLLVALADTYDQWQDTLQCQSGGTAPEVRMMASSNKKTRANLEAFKNGEPGIYMATIQYLMASDFETRVRLDSNGIELTKESKDGLVPDKYRHHLLYWRDITHRYPLDCVVYDEAHLTSNRRATSLRTILSLRGHGGPVATIRKIALSATWLGNSAENGWTLPFWLWGGFNKDGGLLKKGDEPMVPTSYYKYEALYLEKQPQRDKYGKEVYVRGKQMLKVVGEKNPGEWVNTLPLYIRNEQKDHEELNMPTPPEPYIVKVPATPIQERQYADLKDELLAWVDNWQGEREPLVIDVPPVLRARLRQVALAELSLDEVGEVYFKPDAQSAKLHALAGVLRHEMFADQPVVIFTDSKLMANLTAERMAKAGKKVAAYTGDTKREERQRIKQAFIDGEIQYIVGTVQSMGTGLDGLQHVCARIVWMSMPDGDPKLRTQALGRVYRPGRTMQHGGFEHVQLQTEPSLDTEILERLLAKAHSVQASVGAHNLRNN